MAKMEWEFFFAQKKTWRLKLRFKLLFIFALGSTIIFTYEPFFGALHGYLALDKSGAPADALVVEGWVFDSGKELARELYSKGFARTIFTTGGPILRNAFCHKWSTWAEAARGYFISLGIEEARVVPIVTKIRGTRQEALAIRPYLVKHRVSSVIIVTQRGHERRSYLTFRKALRDLNVSVLITAADEEWFRADNWWKSHDGLIFLFTEYLSLFYYWLNGYI